MRKKSPYTSCKIPGCKGTPDINGVYVRGFCARHYGQYRTGHIDLAGNSLKPNNVRKRRVQSFNKVLRRASTLDKKVLGMVDLLEIECSDPKSLFRKKVNKTIPGMVIGMRRLGKHLRSKDFIFGNVEEIHNRTLQGILASREPSFETNIPGVRPYDVVQVVKLLRRGYSTTRIRKLFKELGKAKLEAIKVNYERGAYPTEQLGKT